MAKRAGMSRLTKDAALASFPEVVLRRDKSQWVPLAKCDYRTHSGGLRILIKSRRQSCCMLPCQQDRVERTMQAQVSEWAQTSISEAVIVLLDILQRSQSLLSIVHRDRILADKVQAGVGQMMDLRAEKFHVTLQSQRVPACKRLGAC